MTVDLAVHAFSVMLPAEPAESAQRAAMAASSA